MRYDPSQARPCAFQVPYATPSPQTRSHHRRSGSRYDGRHTRSEHASSSPYHSSPSHWWPLPTRRGRQSDSSPHPSGHAGAIWSPPTPSNYGPTPRAALSAIRGCEPAYFPRRHNPSQLGTSTSLSTTPAHTSSYYLPCSPTTEGSPRPNPSSSSIPAAAPSACRRR